MHPDFELALLGSYLSPVKKPVILELGAGKGDGTIKLVDHIYNNNQDCEYYVFEPDPRNVAYLKTLRVNHFVSLIPVAAGDCCKTAEFYQSYGVDPQTGQEYTESGSLKQPIDFHQTGHAFKPIKVKMMRMDTFFSAFSLTHIDLIQSNVNGAEDLVIAGAKETLQRTHYFYTTYADKAMYQGQLPAIAICEQLGKEWKALQQSNKSILFENTAYNPIIYHEET